MPRRSRDYTTEPKHEVESTVPPHAPASAPTGHSHHALHLPRYNHNGHKVTTGIHPDGESGRRGFNPWLFLKICARSSCFASRMVNFLWPVVPAAIAVHFARPEWHVTIFILNYIAMVPAANLIGFAGQELGRKIPYKAVGVIVETTFGSVVEIVLFMVLLKKSVGNSNVPVIQAAILGSILANLLLCLGTCFIAGGLRREEQSFHPGISEAGSGLMLVAGMGLIIPAIFANALANDTRVTDLPGTTLKISRAAAVILLVAYLIFVFYQTKTHDTLFAEIYEIDEHKDADRHYDLAKEKLTFTECIVALTFAIAIVSLIAVFLVEQIHYIVQRGVSDAFVGLILVPLVEKFAEHLTEVDEAWDNQMNFAIAHVLGASIQTALLNTPLVIIVAWGLHIDMDMNFHLFDSVVLVLAILVVGSFLRDGKSNYLEGVLCVLVYMLIAISAWYYPNPQSEHGGGGGGGEHHRRGLVGQ